MSDGRIMLAIATLIALGAFANGVRFSRMTKNPWADRRVFGQPIAGSDMSLVSIHRFGRTLMAVALLFWVIFAAMMFGLLGPVTDIQTIKIS